MKLSQLSTPTLLKYLSEKKEGHAATGHAAEKINAAKAATKTSQNKLVPEKSKAMISLIKHGKRNPSVDTLQDFAKHGVKLDPLKLPKKANN